MWFSTHIHYHILIDIINQNACQFFGFFWNFESISHQKLKNTCYYNKNQEIVIKIKNHRWMFVRLSDFQCNYLIWSVRSSTSRCIFESNLGDTFSSFRFVYVCLAEGNPEISLRFVGSCFWLRWCRPLI